jgi:hypothetical protein
MSDKKLILVVDDDTDLVEMVSMKLESKISGRQGLRRH